MLENLQTLAVRLQRFGFVFNLIALAALIYGISALLLSTSQEQDKGFIPAIIVFTWAMLARSFVNLFRHLPGPPDTKMKFVTRVKARAMRLVYYGFLVLFASATGFLILTSWQLSSAWRMMY
jgi:fatty acid desaturase